MRRLAERSGVPFRALDRVRRTRNELAHLTPETQSSIRRHDLLRALDIIVEAERNLNLAEHEEPTTGRAAETPDSAPRDPDAPPRPDRKKAGSSSDIGHTPPRKDALFGASRWVVREYERIIGSPYPRYRRIAYWIGDAAVATGKTIAIVAGLLALGAITFGIVYAWRSYGIVGVLAGIGIVALACLAILLTLYVVAIGGFIGAIAYFIVGDPLKGLACLGAGVIAAGILSVMHGTAAVARCDPIRIRVGASSGRPGTGTLMPGTLSVVSNFRDGTARFPTVRRRQGRSDTEPHPRGRVRLGAALRARRTAEARRPTFRAFSGFPAEWPARTFRSSPW